jgi:hydrogenase nickel incorporation protein HypB
MCTTCGCSDPSEASVIGHFHDHDHGHHHDHEHGDHHHDGHNHHHHDHGSIVTLEQQILAKNNLLAERNRGWFAGRGILALNLMSSPGAGKTTLLERTIRDLGGVLEIGVIEGDQATETDAARIRAAGCKAVQINTGTGCHLDADMLQRALAALKPPLGSVVMIENVGNLVCPALFDLGERAKVVMLSVTEGDDKPLKYPHMFRAADLMVITKSDLLPHVDFSIERCLGYAQSVNRSISSFILSARTGEGMNAWYDWLTTQRAVASDELGPAGGGAWDSNIRSPGHGELLSQR